MTKDSVPASPSGSQASPGAAKASPPSVSIPNADIPENRRAPTGMIWRCQACGKTAEDLYGMIGRRSYGWDESCILNAAPVPASGIAARSDETPQEVRPEGQEPGLQGDAQ